jgi:redox-sensitive bicupin YhaK (pirin superfamily)
MTNDNNHEAKTRSVKETLKAHPTMEGAGVRLNRGFGFFEVPHFDPFLLFDDFSSPNPADYLAGFPWHPHRGIETVTYILDGDVRHKDSIGNEGNIGGGDVQWMTAGSGIIHEEMPQGSGGVFGFQLWVNLPQKDKMMAPRYQDVRAKDIPDIVDQGAKVKIISGNVSGTPGPIEDIMAAPTYLDVTLLAGKEWSISVPDGDTAFIYIFEGALGIGNGSIEHVKGKIVHFKRTGERVSVVAGNTGVRFLFVSGRPVGEPVAWRGPIVMNTKEELQTAFDELQMGTFIR